MADAEHLKYLKENVLDKSYDCIFFVVGHSVIGGSTDFYKDVQALTDDPNPTVITGLAAPPGSPCFSSAQLVMIKIRELLYKPLSEFPERCLYGRPPIEVLHRFVDGLKEHTPKEDKRAKMDAFRATTPVLSTNHLRYYNRRWVFETGPKGNKRPGGFAALLYLNKHGVQFLPLYQRQIDEMVVAANGEKRGFYITKTELLQDLFKNTPFRHPLFMDIGCSDFVVKEGFDNPISLEEFMANSIYGGKAKKRKSYRSKKTIRITQR